MPVNWHKVKALRGLLRHRKRVYPQRITLGKMPDMVTEKTRRRKEREAKKRKEWHEMHMCYGCRPFRLRGLPAYWDYENHLAWMGGPEAGYTKNDLLFGGDVATRKECP